MLSSVKFIPREELLSEESAKKMKRKKERKRGHRKSKRHYTDDDDSSPNSSSGSGSDENRRKPSRSSRKSKRGHFSDSSVSSDEEKNLMNRHRKGHRNAAESDPDSKSHDDSDNCLEKKSDMEISRKEMGLEWMLKPANRVRSSSNQKEEADDLESLKAEEEKKGNSRELNPYLKDNGSGYPDDPTEGAGQLLSSSVVGDGGASWRLKALKRAKEQAAREGRHLEEIVEERWGSLGELTVSVYSSRAAPSHAHLQAIRNRRNDQAEHSEDASEGVVKRVKIDSSSGSREFLHAKRDYLHDKHDSLSTVSSRNREMRKPSQDSLSWRKKSHHRMSSENRSLISEAISSINKFANDGSFMDNINSLKNKDAGVSNIPYASSNLDERIEAELHAPKETGSTGESSENKQVLSSNQLAAKILQLKMMGKYEEADQLTKEMEAMPEKQDSSDRMRRTVSHGSSFRLMDKHASAKKKGREDDSDIQLAKQIMQNKRYTLTESVDDEYDFDGAPSRKGKRRNKLQHEEDKSISKRLLTQKERCQFCFENPSRPKHLVISIGNFTYLMLPQWQPVVPGHCMILPLEHSTSTRTVDENVWVEIRNFKKCLLRMFSKQEKDVIFIETVIELSRQRRHCLIECIPIPFEQSDLAPMYFKKAIDEAEEEWGQHEMKKLIPTRGNLRQVIPEHFAYFHVEFGLDKGFVHVIDDESNFRSGFGLNVIRGILKLPEEDMHRRRKHDNMETQKQAVAQFMEEWDPFDWTKEL